MPFVLVLAGLLMIITGAKGTYVQFGRQLASDINGQFLYFAAAIGGLGALGYIDALRTFSRLFMALILIVLVLSNGGFAQKFLEALKSGPVAPEAGTGIPSTNQAQSSGAASGSSSSSGTPWSSSPTTPGGFWDYIGLPSVKSWLGG